MPDWLQSPIVWAWIGFHAFVFLMLAIDLGIFQRKAHAVTMKEAGAWYSVWVILAAIFAAGVWHFRGRDDGLEFVTGYLIEQSLSVDNLFVFLVIFRYFAVPDHLRHRVLFWGILGALIMRATFILAGAALLAAFHWMIYVFGLFLIYTGYKLFRAGEEEIDPARNPVLRLSRRLFPLVDNYDSTRFWVRQAGRLYATPMLLVLLVIESTDVVFALDSIPAIFAITQDIFIVYTSNIFAILGLRSLYFLLANLLGMFRYLNLGLALVLTFVGIKMVIKEPIGFLGFPGYEIPILWSLLVIAAILGVAVLASLLGPRKEHIGHAPEVVLDPKAPPPDVGEHQPDSKPSETHS